jgi:hypothetical protein
MGFNVTCNVLHINTSFKISALGFTDCSQLLINFVVSNFIKAYYFCVVLVLKQALFNHIE